ncbi:hypothetical protein AVEN_9999-1 [Araneus ventricosus]|uniref:Uncharacterized protein n=1 Tax=Araneus ventricosus TaxID=182803 RepID=A0A4Y2LYV7_ARAVE|nr:hypothetical protein AVEN_96621-1 [Araneus ventricosus]GBN19534.1 hypothetical protein AVEN_9999-1 [Araneus ventricosus]
MSQFFSENFIAEQSVSGEVRNPSRASVHPAPLPHPPQRSLHSHPIPLPGSVVHRGHLLGVCRGELRAAARESDLLHGLVGGAGWPRAGLRHPEGDHRALHHAECRLAFAEGEWVLSGICGDGLEAAEEVQVAQL